MACKTLTQSIDLQEATAAADLASCHVADRPMSLDGFQLFKTPVQLAECARRQLIKLFV